MAPLPTPRRRRSDADAPSAATQRWLALVGAALVLAFAAVGWVQYRQVGLLSESVRYEGDNLSWSFFQLESQYLSLRDALREVRRRPAGTPPLTEAEAAELRQRFELFASRLPLVAPDRTQRFIDLGAGHAQVLDRLATFVQQHEALLGEAASLPIDAAGVLPALADLTPLNEPIHDLTLLANQRIAEQIGQRNDAARDQTRLSIVLSVLQCLLTLAFAAISARQFRVMGRHRQQLENLADNLQQARHDADEARHDAESASQAKSAFLANMSHELRTPFNGMLGMLALLEGSRLDADQADQVRTARASARHLMDLLNDILDISKLESGRLEIAPHPIDLHRLIGEVQVLMLLAAESKGLNLAVSVAADVPAGVVADGKRLKQILFNLMSNAVKFTDRGQVRLTVTADGLSGAASPDHVPLHFAVSDTGIGIDEAVQERLFERFAQGDASTSRRYGGTGLGLEISRSLARLMGGDIAVRSQAGAGATFTLMLALPACVPPQAEALPAATALQAGSGPALDLLVVDDHAVNRKFMAILLGRMGHQVRLAANGAEAIDAVRQQAPDLVFMDVHMPVQDGLAATEALRLLPPPAGTVPIVALTADVFDDTRARASAAGMDDFLAKPVQPDAIEATLARLFGDRARVQPADPAPVDHTLPTRESPMTPPAHPRHPSPPPPAAQPAAAATAAAAPRRFKASDVATHLDMAVIGDVCVGVSLAGYQQLLAGFLAADAASLRQLTQALDDGRSADLKALAHAVKGAAASLGLRAIRGLAAETEQAGLGYDAAQCRAVAAQLQALVADARALCARMGFLQSR
jgi:signal transduction histidine kinase/CheY-like chemotaxis protein